MYSIRDAQNYLVYYIIGVLIGHIIFGLATKSINESKGYTGGFAWGFFLGIIGVIVVACKANTSTSSVNNTAELERIAKLHDSGALTDAEFEEMKKKLLAGPKKSKALPILLIILGLIILFIIASVVLAVVLK